MVKIILDCFGGDNSPDAHVKGAVEALKKLPDLKLILTGDEVLIKEKLSGLKYDSDRLEIIHAPQVITCNDKPTDAIRLKKESSMMKAVKLLYDDDSIAGMVTTGSTGAIVTAATVRIGRLRNVIRPPFCPVIPTMAGTLVGICDSGASTDITVEHLQQYAIMGSLYLEKTFGIKNPRVALLNIGTEKEKGDELRKQAYEVLEKTPHINFCGNMESRDLLSGKYDLVVCDGFSGNVLIKTTEGTAIELLKKLKKDIGRKLIYKIGAGLMYKMFMEEKEFMNYQNYGGSVLLGTAKVVVKGHGNSTMPAITKCIEQAYQMEISSLNPETEKILDEVFGEN